MAEKTSITVEKDTLERLHSVRRGLQDELDVDLTLSQTIDILMDQARSKAEAEV